MISVVIPVRNVGGEINDCIQSILCQRNVALEVILVDGGDDSLNLQSQLSAELHQAVKIVSLPGSSIYEAMNKGAFYANYDYIYFLGSDDRLASCTVFENIFSCNRLVSCLPDIIISKKITNFKFFSLLKIIYLRCFHISDVPPINSGMIYSHQAILTSKDWLLKCGGFDTNFFYASDYNFFVNSVLLKCNIKYTNVRIACTGTRGVSAQLRNSLVVIDEYYEVLKGHGLKPGIFLKMHEKLIKFKLAVFRYVNV
jgi:glycosyltransferase involved in cell wall biosynthesis